MKEAIEVADKAGYQGFVTAQNKWNVLQREIEEDLVQICRENEIGILPYYPLEMGLLTGKYSRGKKAPKGSRLAGDARLGSANYDQLELLEDFAKSRGYALLALAISWLVSHKETVSVIAGATRYEQMAKNAHNFALPIRALTRPIWASIADFCETLRMQPENGNPAFINMACPDSFDATDPSGPTYYDNQTCWLTEESPKEEIWSESWDRVQAPGQAKAFNVPGMRPNQLIDNGPVSYTHLTLPTNREV